MRPPRLYTKNPKIQPIIRMIAIKYNKELMVYRVWLNNWFTVLKMQSLCQTLGLTELYTHQLHQFMGIKVWAGALFDQVVKLNSIF